LNFTAAAVASNDAAKRLDVNKQEIFWKENSDGREQIKKA
jgi:hypothetical protein